MDTNIWVYRVMQASTSDAENLRKQQRATDLLVKLAQAQEIVISAQVLGEFFTIVTRKGLPLLSAQDASAATNLLATYSVVSIDAALVRVALERMQRNHISYWDALIVEAAIRAGAAVLYSEDLQHGMRFDTLEVVNPFLFTAQ